MATTPLTYLISRLRLTIGDIDPETYKYLDNWLEIALVAAVSDLQVWWDYKYLIDTTTDLVQRNPKKTYLFEFDEPPVIQTSDEKPILLMAAIIIVSGDLENSAWNIGSWRDAEVSYSNIEGGKTKKEVLSRFWEELSSILTPPGKALARAEKSHLPGYIQTTYEE